MTATIDVPIHRHPPDASALWLRRGAWWLHPAWTAVLVVVPCVAITWLTPGDDFRRWWRTPKYFDTTNAVISALLLAAFVTGTLAPSFARRGTKSAHGRVTLTAAQRYIIARAGRVFLLLTLTGYAVWLLAALSRGYGSQQLRAVLSLEPGALLAGREQYLGTVAGVTTLTQCGPLAVVCLMLDRRISGRRHVLALGALATLTLARAGIYGERLALIEMIVPLIIPLAALMPRESQRDGRRWFWAMLPLLAPVALVLVFGAFEYTRSWNDFYARHSDVGFGEFALRRLDGYYAVAGNNSAILLAHFSQSMTLPYFTVSFIWRFPILSSWWDPNKLLGFDPVTSWVAFLGRYANPEFNNVGGLLPAVADYGLWGALIWWAFIGLLIGFCYRSLRAGELRGLILYAVLYVGVLEMARIFYWGSGRAFPVIVGGFIVVTLLHRARARTF